MRMSNFHNPEKQHNDLRITSYLRNYQIRVTPFPDDSQKDRSKLCNRDTKPKTVVDLGTMTKTRGEHRLQKTKSEPMNTYWKLLSIVRDEISKSLIIATTHLQQQNIHTNIFLILQDNTIIEGT